MYSVITASIWGGESPDFSFSLEHASYLLCNLFDFISLVNLRLMKVMILWIQIFMYICSCCADVLECLWCRIIDNFSVRTDVSHHPTYTSIVLSNTVWVGDPTNFQKNVRASAFQNDKHICSWYKALSCVWGKFRAKIRSLGIRRYSMRLLESRRRWGWGWGGLNALSP